MLSETHKKFNFNIKHLTVQMYWCQMNLLLEINYYDKIFNANTKSPLNKWIDDLNLNNNEL